MCRAVVSVFDYSIFCLFHFCIDLKRISLWCPTSADLGLVGGPDSVQGCGWRPKLCARCGCSTAYTKQQSASSTSCVKHSMRQAAQHASSTARIKHSIRRQAQHAPSSTARVKHSIRRQAQHTPSSIARVKHSTRQAQHTSSSTAARVPCVHTNVKWHPGSKHICTQ
jgi:hypothetical protein